MIGVSRSTLLAGAATIGVAGLIAVQWFGPEPADSPGGDTGAVALHDAVYGRDAQLQTGRLQDCSETGCRIEERVFPRDAIAFVGLGVTSPIPPRVMDPSHDELHLRTGEVVHESLAQIDATRVFAGARTYERSEVAWIYLAPEKTEQEPRYQFDQEPEEPVSDRENPQPDSASSPTSGPEPETPPATPPRSPPDAPIAACPEDQPLGAWIWQRNDYEDVISPNCIGSEIQVVRFRLEPIPGTQAGKGGIALAYAAKELHYRVSTDGCFDVDEGVGQYICNSNAMHTEGTAAISAENLGSALFMPLVPALTFQYPNSMQPELQVTAHCVWDGSGPHAPPPPREIVASLSWNLNISAKECAYAHRYCENYCVAPTACEQTNNADAGCSLRPERFAVIPFNGALVNASRHERSPSVPPSTRQVRWNVCCGCAENGPPPDFGIPEDSCGNLAAERALVDVLWEQRQAYAAGMEAEWNALEQAHREMLDNVEAYRAAIDACAIWDIVSETLESASGWAGEFTEFGTKVLSGDLSAFVGDEPWKSLSERAWDAFPRQSTWAGNMHDRITGCNAPIPHDLRTAALRFVDSWERVRGLMPSRTAEAQSDPRQGPPLLGEVATLLPDLSSVGCVQGRDALELSATSGTTEWSDAPSARSGPVNLKK